MKETFFLLGDETGAFLCMTFRGQPDYFKTEKEARQYMKITYPSSLFLAKVEAEDKIVNKESLEWLMGDQKWFKGARPIDRKAYRDQF